MLLEKRKNNAQLFAGQAKGVARLPERIDTLKKRFVGTYRGIVGGQFWRDLTLKLLDVRIGISPRLSEEH